MHSVDGLFDKNGFCARAHRELSDITADDLARTAEDMRVSRKAAKEESRLLAERFEAIDPTSFVEFDTQAMAKRVMENAASRLAVLKSFAG